MARRINSFFSPWNRDPLMDEDPEPRADEFGDNVLFHDPEADFQAGGGDAQQTSDAANETAHEHEEDDDHVAGDSDDDLASAVATAVANAMPGIVATVIRSMRKRQPVAAE